MISFRKLASLAIVACVMSLSAFAQSAKSKMPSSYADSWQVKDRLLPTTTTLVVPGDSYVEVIRLVNRSSSPVIVTVTNNDADLCGGTFCEVLPSTEVPAKSFVLINLQRTLISGGIRWYASSADSIIGYIKGYGL